jgi:hypothetical protein
MAAVGLPLARPVGGVSEIGTTAIVSSSPYDQISTWCANGPDGQPCMSCHKCFRKALISSVVNDTLLDKKTWQYFASLPVLQDHFSNGEMIEIENAYCFKKLPPIPNLFFARIQRAIQATYPDVDFVERWYPRSLEHIPAQYRDFFVQQKNKYLQDYNKEDIYQLENWRHKPLVLPPPGLAEIIITRSQKKIRGAKRRAKKYLNQMV